MSTELAEVLVLGDDAVAEMLDMYSHMISSLETERRKIIAHRLMSGRS